MSQDRWAFDVMDGPFVLRTRDLTTVARALVREWREDDPRLSSATRPAAGLIEGLALAREVSSHPLASSLPACLAEIRALLVAIQGPEAIPNYIQTHKGGTE